MLLGLVVLASALGAPEMEFRLPVPAGDLPPCRPGTMVLGLDPDAGHECRAPGGLELRSACLAACGLRVVDSCSALGLLCVETGAEDLLAECRRVETIPGVRFAEPNWLGEGGFTPDDTSFPREWQHVKLETETAWDTTRGAVDLVIAILDTGILYNHPEFEGRALPGYDFVNNDDDPSADHPHGVYTTGLLVANAGNAFQVAGVNHFSRILPVKILDDQNIGDEFRLIKGLNWATDHGARIISMSLINFPESNGIKDALLYAHDRGVVLVACSGNSGIGNADVTWPGASPLCITVGATADDDTRASFSGTGSSLDVVAPGKSVITVSPDPAQDSDVSFSGCSAAVPLAAGVCSLILSQDPTLTPMEVQEALQAGAEDRVGGADDVPGWDPNYGWGRINARRSLEFLQGKKFLRGDANGDISVDISDAIFILSSLFSGGRQPLCLEAADANDDGQVNVSDPTVVLNFLFVSGGLPSPSHACGRDPTLDDLGCDAPCSP